MKEGEMREELNRIVAIASSTGGPRALQTLISSLPGDLGVPVLIVQHMPAGFTASLAERLNSISQLSVTEANDGDVVRPNCVYLARGGVHMNVRRDAGKHVIYYTEEPPREGVRPCANYMYESLATCRYDEVICVVMTGMGADGTRGIGHLIRSKKVYVIGQNAESCAVYGMPKSAMTAGIVDKELTLNLIANEITTKVRLR
ncbi:MAG: chemotaxis protein CheB [Lachnospiraceae bacterium]|jgi:two-component system chemotaxis response regulator CheB|nr:chemotaxis protein CheB [Lachnospiraceae bacterium]